MIFNAKDLDQSALRARAEVEAQLIYDKPSTRRNRSLQEVIETVLYGHVAEQYLIEQGWEDDLRPYKDVIHPDGTPVEIKVTEGEYYVQYVLQRANEAARQSWRKYPEQLYIFIGDRSTLDYKLYETYSWNGTQFCVHNRSDVV